MSRKITFYPQAENIELEKPFPIHRIYSYLGIEIERVIGIAPFGNGKATASRTISYPNASEASRKRLHKVVSKLVNKGLASISLFDGGYEVEL